MAQQSFYRFGQTELVKQRVDSATVIERGDMLYLDTDDVKPASSYTWDTNLATTQGTFAEKFIGIAAESSENGDTDPISVDISPLSVYEFVVASATFELSDELGPDENSSALHKQTLEKTGSDVYGIARAYEYKSSAATLLKVKFASAYNPASANINALIG